MRAENPSGHPRAEFRGQRPGKQEHQGWSVEQGLQTLDPMSRLEAAPFIPCDCGCCRGSQGFAEDAGAVCMGERGPGAPLNSANKRLMKVAQLRHLCVTVK
ncbi:uncharacterized protein V6R79_007582 [Siganus canaliculatus]